MKQLTSQMGTTKEQSKKLTTLGVLPQTADMLIDSHGILETIAYSAYDGHRMQKELLPAWSLSRLIEMLPNTIPDPKPGFNPHHPELIKHESGYSLSIRRFTANCLIGTHIEKGPIECCISMIDWLIKNHHFDKEYLA